MEPFTETRLSFSQHIQGLQLAWDSTSLGVFKECPRKYYYNIVRGFTPKAESVDLVFGQIIHSALEHYDKVKFAGATHVQAQLEAVRYTMVESWDKSIRKPREVLAYDDNKNRDTLVRTIVWYLDQFREDTLETVRLANGKPAVELSFRFPLDRQAPSGEDYWMCGHMDRVAKLGTETYIVDRKTTKSTINSDFFDKFKPDNQFSIYTLAGKIVYKLPIVGLIVDGAQVAVTFSRFVRGMVPMKEPELEEFLQDTHLWIDLAEKYAMAGYWPKNEKACGNYRGCPFRFVCSQSPSMREFWLEKSYQKRVWDPFQVRGDV